MSKLRVFLKKHESEIQLGLGLAFQLFPKARRFKKKVEFIAGRVETHRDTIDRLSILFNNAKYAQTGIEIDAKQVEAIAEMLNDLVKVGRQVRDLGGRVTRKG